MSNVANLDPAYLDPVRMAAERERLRGEIRQVETYLATLTFRDDPTGEGRARAHLVHDRLRGELADVETAIEMRRRWEADGDGMTARERRRAELGIVPAWTKGTT